MSDVITSLIKRFSKLPGLGPSSSKRLVLHLLKDKKNALQPLLLQLEQTASQIKTCEKCGNLDTISPCYICSDETRQKTICVVEDVADLWAMERTGSFFGTYHVLGGVLSALDGVNPDDLGIPRLYDLCEKKNIGELIIATSATVDGQSTAHYIVHHFKPLNIKITALAQGMPLGGELDWLDDGTISTAFRARYQLNKEGS